MANYKESTVPCTSYVRAYGVSCTNPREGLKMIQFQEETVIVLPDGTTSTARYGECTKILTTDNAATSFPIRDAETGELTGETKTYMEVYRDLMSLYYHVAHERDAANV